MDHPISCTCGQFHAHLTEGGSHNRLNCYCKDCRAFAHFLGRPGEILDAGGGTQIIQVELSRLRIDRGQEHLSAIRLSEKGLVRWYAACCNTPLGNTFSKPNMAFIGLIHLGLTPDRLDLDFGPEIANLNTASALSTPKPRPKGQLLVILRFLSMVLRARLSGRFRSTALFNRAGAPLVRPQILSPTERAHLSAVT